MKCKICGGKTESIFSAEILGKYNIKYFYCDCCGFLQTEEPYWINECYANIITNSDIGMLSRNLKLAEFTKVLIFSLYSNNSIRDSGLFSNKIFIRQRFKKIYKSGFDFNRQFVDYGGGYGVFVRLMRDIGLDFYWHDAYCQNLFAEQFEADLTNKYKLLTAFEILEHLHQPIEELDKILKLSDNILFSAKLLPDKNLPQPNEWWYYGVEHGQHIAFYSKKTLEYIASKYKLHLYSASGSIHMFTKENINLKFIKFLYKKRDYLSELIDQTSKPRSLLPKDFEKITGKSLVSH